MDETDILLTVAEIGVALAGFASLAAILGYISAGLAGDHGFNIYFTMLCLLLVISARCSYWSSHH